MKSKKQRKQQPKTSRLTDDIGDGEDAAELPNVQAIGGGEQQQANDQPEVEEARDLDREGHSRKQVKGKKRHICQECPMSFDKMFRLKQHIRKHTGEQPFKCEQCNRRFAQLGNLNRHIRTHTGEKPFGCSSCGKYFANSHHLNRHLRTHTGEKPFGCSICGKRFAYAHHLRRHQQMKKDPCKPAAVAADEECQPTGSDDDEHGEEQMSAEITQKAWDEVIQRHQQILARLSSCETRLTTLEQQLKTKGECQGSSAATAAIITSAKATTSTRNNPKKPQKRPATSSFSSNTKAGKAKRSPRPATSSTSSSSSADDECSREAEEPNSSGKEEEYIF